MHLWRSTSRKMTYPLFLFATFYMSGAVWKVHEKKEVRPEEVKAPIEHGQNDVSLYRPSSTVHGGGQNPAKIIQKNKRDLALPSSFYGGLGLEEFSEKVKFFIGTTLG